MFTVYNIYASDEKLIIKGWHKFRVVHTLSFVKNNLETALLSNRNPIVKFANILAWKVTTAWQVKNKFNTISYTMRKMLALKQMWTKILPSIFNHKLWKRVA